MSFKVFYTELGRQKDKPNDLFALPSEQFVSREAALAWAFETRRNGGRVWRIQGPGEFVMTHEDFETKYWGV